MTYTRSFGINLPWNYIQTIRLTCALLEADFDVYFPADAKQILEYWGKYFNVEYQIGLQGVPLLKDISISHEKPFCKIGTLEKTLIFPNQMVTRCRSKWEKNRSIQFLFCGLITEQRKKSLEKWIRSSFGKEDFSVSVTKSSPNRLKRLYYYLEQKINFVNRFKSELVFKDIGLHIFSSNKGRYFPVKVWDEEYYDFLSNSHFVLCPDGDFTWTYRFFESILCGAIPIVENTCDLYNGFEYFSMNDPVEHFIYSQEVAERNFYRAQHLLTVTRESLNKHILGMLEQSVLTA